MNPIYPLFLVWAVVFIVGLKKKYTRWKNNRFKFKFDDRFKIQSDNFDHPTTPSLWSKDWL